MRNIYKDAFIWGVINNFSLISFGFIVYLLLGENLTIEDFTKFILLAGCINIGFAFTEFRLHEVFLRDADINSDNLKNLFMQHFIAETSLRSITLIILSYPVSFFLNLNILEYLFFGISLLLSKIYIGVTSGFAKLSKTSFKIGILILIDLLPKLWYLLIIENISFSNLSFVYAINSIATLITFIIFFRDNFMFFGFEAILNRLKRSKRFIFDNWKLSISEIGIRELDIVIISIFYPPIIVATFRYAKLISGSVWRLIDSSMQIELMRRNIENDVANHSPYKYKLPLTLYVLLLSFVVYFTIRFLQEKGVLFTKFDDLSVFFILSSPWLFFAVYNYKSIASLQFKDQMKYLIFSVFISSGLYLILAVIGGSISEISLPISYSTSMGAYFLLATYFNSRVQRYE